MKNPFKFIQHSLSMRLSFLILGFAIAIFVVSLGVLFYQSRELVKQEAFQRAAQVLNNSALQVTEIMNEVETSTNNIDWLVHSHLEPDSIKYYSRRMLELNPHVNGCSIAFEPFFFEDEGEYFSAYSGYTNDTIETEQEGSDDYRYFDLEWYKRPKETGETAWVEPFFDYFPDTVVIEEMITSYSKPLQDGKGKFIGVISTDLSLKWLSKMLVEEKPYPHSYCIVLGKEGNYIVHPDTTKLLSKTIFSDRDPTWDADIIALGEDMLANTEGMSQVKLNDEMCWVLYRKLPQTDWRLAIVCPESDIFKSYNRLLYIVIAIIVVGLLLLLVFCSRIVNNAIVPLNQLARRSHHIAKGHFDEHLSQSERQDAVGQLQNSFDTMQQSLSEYVNDIQRMNTEIEQRNEDLVKANELANEASLKKTAQVLRDNFDFIEEEEMVAIIDAMQENSHNISGIVDMLIDASILDEKTSLERNDLVDCKELCHNVFGLVKRKRAEGVEFHVETRGIPDGFKIRTNFVCLQKILKQLLDNSVKFTQQGHITLSCETTDGETVRFLVADTGIGIPEEEKDRIFLQFMKLDYYTEGIGLGLSLCKRGAELMGGDLELDTTWKPGTRFILTLKS